MAIRYNWLIVITLEINSSRFHPLCQPITRKDNERMSERACLCVCACKHNFISFSIWFDMKSIKSILYVKMACETRMRKAKAQRLFFQEGSCFHSITIADILLISVGFFFFYSCTLFDLSFISFVDFDYSIKWNLNKPPEQTYSVVELTDWTNRYSVISL